MRYNSQIHNHCAIDCLGASTFRYSGEEGYVGSCSFKGSGASRLLTEDLEMEYLDVRLSEASESIVNVKNTITGSLTGASALKYKGETDVSGVSTAGASSIKKM